MRKWLTQLGEAEDAPLNDRLEFYRLTICEHGVKCKELFIAGMASCNCELHLQWNISVLARWQNVALSL